MTLLFAALLLLGAVALLGIHYLTRWNRMKTVALGQDAATFPPRRYQPMLRLLSADDAALLAGNKALAQRLRKQRMEIFRGYLSSLSLDYARLLAAVRESMAKSGVDRPDLAAALVSNQVSFTLAICRIEYRLLMNSLGVGSVDVSGLVEAISALQDQLQTFQPVMGSVG